MAKAEYALSPSYAVHPCGRRELLSMSFVAVPANPKARVYSECPMCKKKFPLDSCHPDSECDLKEVYDVHCT